jgi:hypothetical protein
MASFIYTKAKQAFLGGQINLSTDTIKAALVTSSYVPDQNGDQFVDDLGLNRLGTDQTLTGKTITNGVFDADNATFPSITGPSIGGIVIYKDTGDAATSPLIAYIGSGIGLPAVPDGSNVVVSWPNTDFRIFKL